MREKVARLEYISWQEGVKLIAPVNPEFAAVIEELDLPPRYQLVKARYPWGVNILKDAELFLPNASGKIVSIHDHSIDPKLKKDLWYNNTVPLGIVLNNALETYIDTGERSMPFWQLPMGSIFGLWPSLEDDDPIYAALYAMGKYGNVVTGTHLPVVIPKITDKASFKKLRKEFHLRERVPNSTRGHLNLLKELAHHHDFPEPWHAEVIFFTGEWLKNRKEPKWCFFQNNLLNTAWSGASNTIRNQLLFDVIFSCALRVKNLKPSPFLSDTAKFLYLIAQGAYPGFRVAENSLILPKKGFQQVLNEHYELPYVPNIVHPGYIGKTPIYYSLDVLTQLSFSPASKKLHRKIEDLREITHIMRVTLNYLKQELAHSKDIPHLEKIPLYRAIHQVNFSYFHTEADSIHNILGTAVLPSTDSSINADMKSFPGLPFCETSPFLRGCIQLTIKE